MTMYMRIWKGSDELLEYKMVDSKEFIVKDGVEIKTDNGNIKTYVVVASDGIYHPVFDLWVNE